MIGPAWLFCPADRPERYAKAAAASDQVIVDLEDGVSAEDKAAARAALGSAELDPQRTVVRINAVGSPEHDADRATVDATPYRRVMLPKCEGPEDAAAIDAEVIALIETPRGVMSAAAIAVADNVIGLMWGAEDLVAAMGGTASRRPDGSYREPARYVRSTVLLAAKAAHKLALDAVYLNLDDLDGLRIEAMDAAAVGFDATVALHPRQIPVIRAAYRPSGEELVWANAVLHEAQKHRGAFSFAGRMVDAPLLRHAEQILRRAGRAEGRACSGAEG